MEDALRQEIKIGYFPDILVSISEKNEIKFTGIILYWNAYAFLLTSTKMSKTQHMDENETM